MTDSLRTFRIAAQVDWQEAQSLRKQPGSDDDEHHKAIKTILDSRLRVSADRLRRTGRAPGILGRAGRGRTLCALRHGGAPGRRAWVIAASQREAQGASGPDR